MCEVCGPIKDAKKETFLKFIGGSDETNSIFYLIN